MQYTGEDWPYEALAEQKEACNDKTAYVFLAGQREDVDAISEILGSLSFLRRFGRQFDSLYKMVVVRRDRSNNIFNWQSSFKHRCFSVSVNRIALLKMFLSHCTTLCFEIAYKDGNGVVVVERNFDYQQGTLNKSLEDALIAKGWAFPKQGTKGTVPIFASIEEWMDRRNKKSSMEIHTEDRWWNELRHLWDKKS